VSGAGNVNGDAYDDVIVGAQLYDNGEADEGAAFVYHGPEPGRLALQTAGLGLLALLARRHRRRHA